MNKVAGECPVCGAPVYGPKANHGYVASGYLSSTNTAPQLSYSCTCRLQVLQLLDSLTRLLDRLAPSAPPPPLPPI